MVSRVSTAQNGNMPHQIIGAKGNEDICWTGETNTSITLRRCLGNRANNTSILIDNGKSIGGGLCRDATTRTEDRFDSFFD
jgi:hypothetical protein